MLTLYAWYSLFDSYVSILCFLWLNDFLWFEYFVLNFVSNMP